MRIVGICGQAGSGKTEAGQYIEKKYGIKLYNLSDILLEEAQKRGLPTQKNDLAKLADELRNEYNNAIVSQRLLERLKKEDVQIAVVAGFRSPEEVDYIRNEVDEFLLIWIDADPVIRYERRRERELSEEEFFSRDEDDLKVKRLGKVLLMADIKIVNDGSEEDLFEKIDLIVKNNNFTQ